MQTSNSQSRRFRLATGIGLLLIISGLALALVLARALSADNSQPQVLGQVGDFNLTNQAGAAVALADLRGHPWVADIIFTRCAGSCPIMSAQMKSLQDALPPTSRTKLVTLTTDPDFDTPEILKRYGDRFGADPHRWVFLTGTKPQIAALAVGGLKLSAVPVKAADRKDAADLFVHSTIFVLVDQQGRLRGIYQTAGEGVSWRVQKKKILAALNQLEGES